MKSFFKKIIGLFSSIAQSINQSHVFAYASQATLFVVISVIPFLMLLLNLLQAFLPFTASMLEELLKDFLPPQVHPFAHEIVGELAQKVNIPILSLTTLALVWTSSRGVKAIAQGIRFGFKSEVKLNYFKDSLYSLLYTLVSIVFILIVTAVMLFGKVLSDIIKTYLPGLESIQMIIRWRYLIFIVILVLVFMTAYKFLGKTKIPFSNMLAGAVFSSLGWVGASAIYSLYIENFSRASYIYGSLAAVMFLLLWVWLCMIILLLGAHINRFIYENEQSIFKEIKGFWQKH